MSLVSSLCNYFPCYVSLSRIIPNYLPYYISLLSLSLGKIFHPRYHYHVSSLANHRLLSSRITPNYHPSLSFLSPILSSIQPTARGAPVTKTVGVQFDEAGAVDEDLGPHVAQLHQLGSILQAAAVLLQDLSQNAAKR